jgi:sporulation protein YlmC with PRC-barrel domain
MNIRLLAGLAPAAILSLSPCMAQQDQPGREDRTRPRDRAMDRQDQGRRDMDKQDTGMNKGGQEARGGMLIKGKNIVGAKVVNKANENLGKIDDLLVDTRNGYTVYGIISEGGVLGIGDKLIAVPWTAFDVLPTSDGDATVVLDTTKEQLKAAPNFDKKEWPLIGERKWMARTHDYFKTEPSYRESGSGGWGRDSTLVRDWSKGQDIDVKGTVVRTDRMAGGRGMGEATTLVVKGDDGQEHTVTLGPSWFLQGQAVSFKEGDQVQIKAHKAMFRDKEVIVARDLTTGDGTKLTLRSPDGVPAWDTTTTAANEQAGGGDTFIRATELNGKNVQGAGDKKIADVKEFAVNPRSGRIPFLILSSGGLAGMGDREIVVPWQAVSFVKQGDKLALNADENTLKSAPQLGNGGFAMVNDPQFRQQVYSFFGGSGRLYATPEPGMNDTGTGFHNPQTDSGRGPIGHEGDAALDAWRAGSEYNKLYTGSPVTLTGTIQDVTTTSPMKGMSDAATLTIKSDQGTKTVQVGPSWYVGRQDVRFFKGDQVTVKGVNATVNGEQVVMASEITTSHGTLRLRDDQGRPLWDVRGGSGSDMPRRGMDRDRDQDKDRKDQPSPG